MAHFGWVIAATLLGIASAHAAGPLDRYRWTSRVLVVSTPDVDDPGLTAQRAILSDHRAGLTERDLVVIEALGTARSAVRLRDALGLRGDRFRVALIGKDGGTKRLAVAPLSAATLFETIDAMPMRRGEMRR